MMPVEESRGKSTCERGPQGAREENFLEKCRGLWSPGGKVTRAWQSGVHHQGKKPESFQRNRPGCEGGRLMVQASWHFGDSQPQGYPSSHGPRAPHQLSHSGIMIKQNHLHNGKGHLYLPPISNLVLGKLRTIRHMWTPGMWKSKQVKRQFWKIKKPKLKDPNLYQMKILHP